MTRATYRLQLRPEFGFAAAAEVAPLLAQLGITHLYLSPISASAPGSTHGYDAVDPTQLSEELGGSAGFAELVGAARSAGLGLVIDIVPNHLAAHPANRWWWDVLEDGPASAGAAMFDIDWEGGGEASAFTVLVPVLGDHVGRAIEAGEICLVRDGARCTVRSGDHVLPLSPRTLDQVLGPAARALGSAPLADLADRAAALPDARLTDARAVHERHERKEQLQRELAELVAATPDVGAAIDAELDRISADPDLLDQLLLRQNYRLARWRTASEELDYRRFFSIESLVGVRVEDPAVFDATHQLVGQLLSEGVVDGVRVDHVDGLRDPAGYLGRLRTMAGGAPIVVEKILGPDEQLPSWPVEGTTGYDFLTRVGGLFVVRASEHAMTEAYASLTGAEPDFDRVALDAKRHVMRFELAAEVDRMVRQLARVCEAHRRHRDHTRRELRDALTELVASFDVYRTYVRPGEPIGAVDRAVLHRARDRAVRNRPDIDAELIGFLVAIAAGEVPGAEEAELCVRLQQLTAPVMAKGVEDTAFYRYHRLISLNEVGGHPGDFGGSTAAFHAAMEAAAQERPETMLALSTHDTKRSADVRARISVLSEEPEAWRTFVERSMEHNDHHWRPGTPDRNVEYLLYQTLVGAWPVDADRMAAFVEKAVREAKVHTSWTDPDEAYESSVLEFVRGVHQDRRWRALLQELLDGVGVAARGRRSSLAQTALLLTCPGNPDLYQGSERWDLSLTDPDNRRPVDYEATRDLLARGARTPGPDPLDPALGDGAKVWLTRRLLQLRRDRPQDFAGAYEPIDLGPGSGALAFRRGETIVVAAVRTQPRHVDGTLPLAGGGWHDALRGRRVAEDQVPVGTLLAGSPVAVLTRAGR